MEDFSCFNRLEALALIDSQVENAEKSMKAEMAQYSHMSKTRLRVLRWRWMSYRAELRRIRRLFADGVSERRCDERRDSIGTVGVSKKLLEAYFSGGRETPTLYVLRTKERMRKNGKSFWVGFESNYEKSVKYGCGIFMSEADLRRFSELILDAATRCVARGKTKREFRRFRARSA